MSEETRLTIIRRSDVAFHPVAGNGAAGLSLARLYQPADRGADFPAGADRAGRGVAAAPASLGADQLGSERPRSCRGRGRAADDRAGDCVVFPSMLDHAITNTGEEPLVLVALLGPGAN